MHPSSQPPVNVPRRRPRSRPRRWHWRWGWTALLAITLFGATGCFKLALKDLGQPMSPRDLALRNRTREFGGAFAEAVQGTADAISAQSTNKAVQAEVARWKIGASGAASDAVLRADPMLALADVWVLCRQMADFLGAGTNQFGAAHAMASAKARQLETNVSVLAQAALTDAELQSMSAFVAEHAERFPIRSLSFQREPVAAYWMGSTNAPQKFTVGTTPEALAELSSRVALSTRQVRDEMRWRLEVGAGELESALKRTQETAEQFDQALRRIAAVAEIVTPAMTSAVALATKELQAGFLPALERVEGQWTNTLAVIRQEREAVARDLAKERAELIKAVGEQRSALLKELDRTAVALTDQAATHLRATIRDVAIYAVLFVLVLLGLPFGFGYLAGRAMSRRGGESGAKT